MKRIGIIDSVVNSDEVKSMIALINYKGIGIKAMEYCFRMVMKSPKDALLFNE